MASKQATKRHRNCARSGGKWLRPNKRRAIYRRDEMCCVYCRRSVEETPLSVDHVLPQALGGTNHESNLVTACLRCNSAKGSKSLRAFLSYLRGNGTDTAKIANRIRRQTARKLVKE